MGESSRRLSSRPGRVFACVGMLRSCRRYCTYSIIQYKPQESTVFFARLDGVFAFVASRVCHIYYYFILMYVYYESKASRFRVAKILYPGYSLVKLKLRVT
jgi:hypothetical protein